jgi:DNA-3-methyladenine glycosylase I
MSLEGFQAGLSWITILRKRPRFREVFAGFEPDAVARFDEADVERLMADAGIIRNRAKILATMGNARLVEAMAPGELDALMWSFAPSPRPTGERPARFADVPATTAASDALSKALKKRGFRFVGRRRCTRSCSRRAWSMTTSSGAIARREAPAPRARAYPRSRVTRSAVPRSDAARREAATTWSHHAAASARCAGVLRGGAGDRVSPRPQLLQPGDPFRIRRDDRHHGILSPVRERAALLDGGVLVGDESQHRHAGHADELRHRRRIARGSAVALHQGGIRP